MHILRHTHWLRTCCLSAFVHIFFTLPSQKPHHQCFPQCAGPKGNLSQSRFFCSEELLMHLGFPVCDSSYCPSYRDSHGMVAGTVGAHLCKLYLSETRTPSNDLLIMTGLIKFFCSSPALWWEMRPSSFSISELLSIRYRNRVLSAKNVKYFLSFLWRR